MSDIVERLDEEARESSARSFNNGCAACGISTNVATDARDEILRLRAALEAERVWEASDPTAQTEPLTAGQRIVAWWETATVSEPCELAQKIDQALRAERERCAKVVDNLILGKRQQSPASV